jgi:hypothetical protein
MILAAYIVMPDIMSGEREYTLEKTIKKPLG